LYTNENFPLPAAEELRRLGHDVVTIQERGRGGEGVPDPDVLSFAIQEDRAVVTVNRKDFIRLHKASAVHAGIIVCTDNPKFIELAHRIHEAIASIADLHGQLVRVSRPRK